jgi:hypothetical protein
MAEVKKQDFSESALILDDEDEATPAAIDRGIKAAGECASGLQNPLHRRRVS